MRATTLRVLTFMLALALLSGAACKGGDDDTADVANGDDDDNDDSSPADDDDDDDDDDNDDNDDDNDDDDNDDDNDDDDNDDDNDDDDNDDNDDNDNDDNDTSFPACDDYGPAENVGFLDAAALTETSGLAVSLQNPGVLWAHNDSGDGPYLYAFTLTGGYLGRVTLQGVTAVDWEDMAAGPCPAGECLYVGDIGDNGNSRTDCAVYRVPEPAVDPGAPFGELSLTTWERFPFSYPDGPQDAEALAVHPDGSVYIFAKYPGGSSAMFVFPELTPDDPKTLDYLGDLDTGGALSLTTAADIHRNGQRLLVRTYVSAMEWRLADGEPFANILDAPRIFAPFGAELQGEAIAYDPATGGYFHAAEGSLPTLYRVSCDASGE